MTMKHQIFIKRVVPVCLLCASSACSQYQVTDTKLVIQSVYSSNNCTLNKPVLKTINSQTELNQLLQSMPKQFGMHGMREPEVNFKEVNFKKEIMILYGIGQKPSSGYSIELYKSNAELKNKKLYLPVRIQSPASGSSQAQMMSSPCKVFLLPRVEYSEIVIKNNFSD